MREKQRKDALITIMLISFLLIFFWGGGETRALANGKTSSSTISIQVREADLRDVLSALAVKTKTSIILMEKPTKITFQAENVSPMKALELMLQGEGLSYIQDGKLLVVGKEEKLHERFFNQMTLTRFDLLFITADQLEDLIGKFGVPVKGISLDANEYSIWFQGTPQSLSKVRELINAVDVPENAAIEISDLEFREIMTYAITPSRAAELVSEAGIPLNRYIAMGNRLLVFDRKVLERWEQFEAIISEVDNINAREQSVFLFTLHNTLAKDAAEMLEVFEYEEVKTITFNFPELTRELLVICPPELETEVYVNLVNIDGERKKIKAVITSAKGEYARKEIIAKRKLLSEMTGISTNSMNISDNLSGDVSKPHYVLWTETTPDRVQLLRELVKSLE